MISSISDVHIKTMGDSASQVLLQFFKSEKVKNSKYIFLLGDIFDLMCGDHPEYIKRFLPIFNEIKSACERGAQVYYFEGNHDLHLEKVFSRFFNTPNFRLIQKSLEFEIQNKKIFFSHGDEYDMENTSYQNYKKYVVKKPVQLFVDYIMPLVLLDFIGNWASANSKKRAKKTFNAEKVKEKIRSGVSTLSHEQHFIIGGHSHIRDEFKFGNNQIYFNNGFPMKDRVFLYFDGNNWKFEPIPAYEG